MDHGSEERNGSDGYIVFRTENRADVKDGKFGTYQSPEGEKRVKKMQDSSALLHVPPAREFA